MINQAAIAEVRSAEEARVNALLSADWDTLDGLLAEDLVHYHANGDLDSKASFLERVRTKLEFLKVERHALTIRIFGDVAIVTGPLHQAVRVKGPGTILEMQGVATQTWVKQSGKWLQNSYQAGRIG